MKTTGRTLQFTRKVLSRQFHISKRGKTKYLKGWIHLKVFTLDIRFTLTTFITTGQLSPYPPFNSNDPEIALPESSRISDTPHGLLEIVFVPAVKLVQIVMFCSTR